MSDNLKNVLVAGTGEIAKQYCRVLKKMNIHPDVVGRNFDKAETFGREEAVNAYGGGIDSFLEKPGKQYGYAIVAVDLQQLCNVTCSLINHGIKNIFTEKPCGMNKEEIHRIADLADKHDASVYVAYNRRFYASTSKALEIIEEDGGVKSFHFEFTEWAHTIEPLSYSQEIKEEWFLANSSHVADLAFFLGGEPREMSCYVSGALKWHTRGCVYSGAGVSEKGALFSYQANWAAPGRWSVEILTAKHRLYFRPMEKLSVQDIASVAINSVELDDDYDTEFKPGFYREVESFINDIEDGRKKTISDQLRYMDYFEKIEGVN